MSDRTIHLPQVSYERTWAGEWCVVTERKTGRPISDLLSWKEAGTLAVKLNTAAYCGKEALDRALGASVDLV